MDIVRWTSCIGKRMVDIVLWTLYIGHRMVDIVRWRWYSFQVCTIFQNPLYFDHTRARRGVVFRTYLTTPSRSRAGGQMVMFFFFHLTCSMCWDRVKIICLATLFCQPYLEQLPGGGVKVAKGVPHCLLRFLDSFITSNICKMEHARWSRWSPWSGGNDATGRSAEPRPTRAGGQDYVS